MVDWVAALSGVSTALKIAKDLRDLDNSLDKAVLRSQVVSMMEQLTDVKLQIIEAREEASEKDQVIAQLRKDLNFRQTSLVDKGQWRYLANGAGLAQGFPICPVCEKKGTFLPLVQDRSRGAGGAVYVCPSCKANYGQRLPWESGKSDEPTSPAALKGAQRAPAVVGRNRADNGHRCEREVRSDG